MKEGFNQILVKINLCAALVWKTIIYLPLLLVHLVKKHVKVISAVIGIFVSAFIGAYISMKLFEPHLQCMLAEHLYLSSIDSIASEVRENNSTLSTIETTILMLKPAPIDVDEKVHNLTVISSTPELSTARYQQIVQYYGELPVELKKVYKSPELEIAKLYDAYTEVNRHIVISRNTVIGTLSFQTWIVDNYLPSTFNNLNFALQHAQYLSTSTDYFGLNNSGTICGNWFDHMLKTLFR